MDKRIKTEIMTNEWFHRFVESIADYIQRLHFPFKERNLMYAVVEMCYINHIGENIPELVAHVYVIQSGDEIPSLHFVILSYNDAFYGYFNISDKDPSCGISFYYSDNLEDITQYAFQMTLKTHDYPNGEYRVHTLESLVVALYSDTYETRIYSGDTNCIKYASNSCEAMYMDD